MDIRPWWVVLAQWCAMLIPVIYAGSRVLWAAGVPVGISASRLEEMGLPGAGSLTLVLLSLPALATSWFVWWFASQRNQALPGWVPAVGSMQMSRRFLAGLLLVPIVILAYANLVNLVVMVTDLAPGDDMAALTTWSLWTHLLLFLAWWIALSLVTIDLYRVEQIPVK